MGNKYVDYVTDEHFEECVKCVINGYTQKRDIRQNGVDAFKTIFDITQTQVIKSKFSRILSWYDNEWGFSNRMCDTAIQIHKLI